MATRDFLGHRKADQRDAPPMERSTDPRPRPAAPTDWSGIEAILLAAGLPAAGAREHLATFVVAAEADRVVATAGLELYGQSALLRSVAVDPAARGHGLGARLVEASLALARTRGTATVVLLTLDAADYFTRFGFARVSTDQVPDAVKSSTQFQGICPASAIAMLVRLA